mgnify:CR=1 FL=1
MPSRSRVSEDDSDDSEWPGERGIGGQREGIGLGLAPAVVVVVTVGVAVRGWRQRGGERFLVSTNLEGPLFSFLFFLETDSGCSQFFFASPCYWKILFARCRPVPQMVDTVPCASHPLPLWFPSLRVRRAHCGYTGIRGASMRRRDIRVATSA